MKHQSIAYPRLAHRIDDAVEVSGIGRSTLFEHIRHGRLKSVKIGGLRLIPDAALREFLQISTEKRAG
jgi:excisionase family DNA binding protein